jgi:hypothetical protein
MGRKKALVEQQAILADPLPEKPIAIAPTPDWRFSLTPPLFDGDTGERVTEVAEDWRRDSAELPWQVVRCCQCQDLMATRDPKLHDCCESCGYRIRQDFYERRQADIRRATDKLINPFASRDIFAEGASLPSVGPSKR